MGGAVDRARLTVLYASVNAMAEDVKFAITLSLYERLCSTVRIAGEKVVLCVLGTC